MSQSNIDNIETNIKKIIKLCSGDPTHCGFEVFVVMKSVPKLKKMGFWEGSPTQSSTEDNLKVRLQEMALQVLDAKFTAQDMEYVSADMIADNQQKFYIVPASESYNPFGFLEQSSDIHQFFQKDIEDATGIFFEFNIENNTLWAYQHLWSIMVPNKSRKYFMAQICKMEKGDIFEELRNPVMTIAKRIDLLIFKGYIITDNYKLLQDNFNFLQYIRERATNTVNIIKHKGIVTNIDKMNEYMQRSIGSSKYIKKLMRIADSRVLSMSRAELMRKIRESPRWNGKLSEKDGAFLLKTYKQVEDFIDLLDERFTRSEITGEEYDTFVKSVAKPI